jgi:hypothetical protein
VTSPDTPATTDELIKIDPILKYFAFEHLREGPLRTASSKFAVLALNLARSLPRNPERTVALRKLLEAKDAAVRAALD